jgi:uncharacterized membrane protein
MQCPICHNEVSPQSAFCTQCGAPLAAATGSAAGVPPPPSYAAQPVAPTSGLSDNTAAAVAYLTIIPAIIFLVLEPYNRTRFVRFHSWQSIVLGIAAFLLQAIVSIAQVTLHFIPGVFLLFSLFHLVVAVGLFVLWLLAIVKASRGEWYKLPILGDFAERQARS